MILDLEPNILSLILLNILSMIFPKQILNLFRGLGGKKIWDLFFGVIMLSWNIMYIHEWTKVLCRAISAGNWSLSRPWKVNKIWWLERRVGKGDVLGVKETACITVIARRSEHYVVIGKLGGDKIRR